MATPQTVTLVDRSTMAANLNGALVLRPRETAILTIDMHRGHLDMDVATMPAKPEDATRVIEHSKTILDHARAQGMPVIHI